jgi:penicillin-binding protein 1A
MGNDNYLPTRNLTGGILPAQVWKDALSYAHRGVVLEPIPFVDPPFEKPAKGAPQVATAADPQTGASDARPATLPPATSERLATIKLLLRPAPATGKAPPSRPTLDTAALPVAAGD